MTAIFPQGWAQFREALETTGSWRGTLTRAQMAQLRLLGYRVVVIGPVGDAFDVEVT